MATRRSSSDIAGTLLLLGVGAGVAYVIYEMATAPTSPTLPGQSWLCVNLGIGCGNTPASSVSELAYNALTGKPTQSQIALPSSNVYSGPNAPAENAAMASFLNSGGDVNTVIPGTGLTATDLLNAPTPWSWSEINQLWQQAGGSAAVQAQALDVGKASSWWDWLVQQFSIPESCPSGQVPSANGCIPLPAGFGPSLSGYRLRP